MMLFFSKKIFMLKRQVVINRGWNYCEARRLLRYSPSAKGLTPPVHACGHGHRLFMSAPGVPREPNRFASDRDRCMFLRFADE